MHKVDPVSLVALERNHGVPEIREFISKQGDNIRYYKFVKDDEDDKSKKK